MGNLEFFMQRWLNSTSHDDFIKNTRDLISLNAAGNLDQDTLRRLNKIVENSFLNKPKALNSFLYKISKDLGDHSQTTKLMLDTLRKDLLRSHLTTELFPLDQALSQMILVTDNPKALLIKAAEEGDVNIIKELQGSQKIDINFLDDQGKSPLGCAASKGHYEAVKLLVDSGADVNMPNNDGETPLILAADNKDIAEFLVDRGADFYATDKLGASALKLATWAGYEEIVELFLTNPKALLISAVKKGDTDIIRELLDSKKFDINFLDDEGMNPLGRAAYLGHGDVAKLLLDHGANINAQNKDGKTALYFAALRGNEDTVKLLIANKADPKITDAAGRTALVMAALVRKQGIFKLIESALSPSELLRQKKILKLISVSHSIHEKGTSELHAVGSPSILVNLEGGKTPYWLKRMSNATQAIQSTHPDLLSADETNDLVHLLSTGINPSFQTIQERLKKGLPCLLNTGFSTHAVEVLIWGHYFILCNRGEANRKNIEVYQFDPTKFDEKIFNMISTSTSQGVQFYQQLFFRALPPKLDFKQEKFEKDLEQVCNLASQVIGNCTWASPEAAIWAFFVLRDLLGNESGTLGPSKPITEEETAKFKESKKFYTWLVFNQMYNLERYLGLREIRPIKDIENEEKNNLGKQLFTVDQALVAKAFDAIKEKLNQNIQDEALASKILRSLNKIVDPSI